MCICNLSHDVQPLMPAALLRSELVDLCSSPLSSLRLPADAYYVISSLGIASRRTHRGCRSGKSARRARAAKRFLPVGLINANSANNKVPLIAHFIQSNNLDILVITETKFSVADGPDDARALCPEGFSIVQVSRDSVNRGGGVAVLYRDSIVATDKHQCVPQSHPTTFEYMSLALTVNSVVVRLVVVYRPPKSSLPCFIQEFAEYLELLSASTGKLLIMGDFNIHVDRPDSPAVAKFLSTLVSFGLTQHIVDATHIDGHTLDLVITRSSDDFIYDSFVSDLISDHFAVISVVRAHKPLLLKKKISYRCFSVVDADELASDISRSPLVCNPASTIDGLLLQYNAAVTAGLDRLAPMKTKMCIVRPSSPWFSGEISAARRRCRKLERVWRRRRLTIDKDILLHHIRQLRKLMNDTKASFFKSKIDEMGNDRRGLFQLLDRCLSRDKVSKLPVHADPATLADRFGRYFDEKIVNIRANLDAKNAPSADSSSSAPNSFLSVFELVLPAEICEIVDKCPAKSSFVDPVPTNILKKIIHVLAKPFASLINLSLSSGVFPDSMKLASITPLLKKASLNPEELSNFRPVSGLSFLSKLLERVVLRRLTSHMLSLDLMVPVQSAYRANHSTETALLRVMNDLLLAVDEGDGAALVLLDLSAAFDTIDHSVLLSCLECRFGLNGVVLDWFRSYLSNRKQSVRISGKSSTPSPLLFGVPQGSVLGPVLFTMYLSPLDDIVSLFEVLRHYFADDTQLYKRFRILADGSAQRAAFSCLSDCVKSTNSWMVKNKLQLNAGKTDVLIASSARSRKFKPVSSPLDICDEPITPSPFVKNLGVIVDSHLNMERQVNTACRNAYYYLRRISRIRKFLDAAACNQLVCALVIPHLDYGNSLFYGLPDYLLDKLQLVQNAAVRLVTQTKKREHITCKRKSLHWLPIRQRVMYKIAVLAYQCVNGIAPSYLCKLVSPRSVNRRLRNYSEISRDLGVPVKLPGAYGSRSFTYAAPQIWNSLPIDLKMSPSIENFRAGLKTHLFKLAYPD